MEPAPASPDDKKFLVTQVWDVLRSELERHDVFLPSIPTSEFEKYWLDYTPEITSREGDHFLQAVMLPLHETMKMASKAFPKATGAKKSKIRSVEPVHTRTRLVIATHKDGRLDIRAIGHFNRTYERDSKGRKTQMHRPLEKDLDSLLISKYYHRKAVNWPVPDEPSDMSALYLDDSLEDIVRAGEGARHRLCADILGIDIKAINKSDERPKAFLSALENFERETLRTAILSFRQEMDARYGQNVSPFQAIAMTGIPCTTREWDLISHSDPEIEMRRIRAFRHFPVCLFWPQVEESGYLRLIDSGDAPDTALKKTFLADLPDRLQAERIASAFAYRPSGPVLRHLGGELDTVMSALKALPNNAIPSDLNDWPSFLNVIQSVKAMAQITDKSWINTIANMTISHPREWRGYDIDLHADAAFDPAKAGAMRADLIRRTQFAINRIFKIAFAPQLCRDWSEQGASWRTLAVKTNAYFIDSARYEGQGPRPLKHLLMDKFSDVELLLAGAGVKDFTANDIEMPEHLLTPAKLPEIDEDDPDAYKKRQRAPSFTQEQIDERNFLKFMGFNPLDERETQDFFWTTREIIPGGEDFTSYRDWHERLDVSGMLLRSEDHSPKIVSIAPSPDI